MNPSKIVSPSLVPRSEPLLNTSALIPDPCMCTQQRAETWRWSSVLAWGCICHLKWPHIPCRSHGLADKSLDELLAVHRHSSESKIYYPNLGFKVVVRFKSENLNGSACRVSEHITQEIIHFCTRRVVLVPVSLALSSQFVSICICCPDYFTLCRWI